ncbi:MAG: GntR family transcriptional regulator [Actinobacteria bacterium]|nr:GntR family transcriptional regulator [Actinomycetota bacterium]
MIYKIEKDSPIPYYYQIQQLIKKEILDGQWKPGEFMPSERELSESFNVSRVTIRQALDNLLLEGIIKKVKAKGTIVSKPKIEEQLFNKLIGTFQDLTEKGYRIKNKILGFSLEDPEEKEVLNLNLSSKDKVYRFERLRFIEDEPYHYSFSSIPQKLCPGFNAEFLIKESMINMLDKHYGLRIYRLKRILEATIATPYDSKLFNTKVGSPVLLFYNTAFLKDNTPVEYTLNKIRGDMSRFEIDINLDRIEDITHRIGKQ